MSNAYCSLLQQVRLDLEAARSATQPAQADDDESESEIPGKRNSVDNSQPQQNFERTPKSKKTHDFFEQVLTLLEFVQ